ncbi:MAG: methylated-DNA--[protein]-cysteine S-methyltransferase [Candidatus Cloacimonetes bacterium]|nr:methylated-DNA--[protein]-cysteine S-methyltransferase [Candidatus Cloacimonadota bacterium]
MPEEKYSCEIVTPLGTLTAVASHNKLQQLVLGFLPPEIAENTTKKESPVLKETEIQLKEYFAGKRRHFDLELEPLGTEFQKLVWQKLLTIPWGETISYEELAMRTGSPKKTRAVGNANSRNPIPIIIPCHRVICKNGQLGGYAGGLDKKRFLLELEKNPR